jgi:hypothetical protein
MNYTNKRSTPQKITAKLDLHFKGNKKYTSASLDLESGLLCPKTFARNLEVGISSILYLS